MKHLVIAVSPDSSLELLGGFADVVVLDMKPLPTVMTHYETLYIRSHFGQQNTLPQNFRTEIDDLVRRARQVHPDIKFIDGADTVDKIVACEDKWLQYETYGDCMPKTRLLDDMFDITGFERPVYKNRLSSRGNGVTWDREEVTIPFGNWIIQESLEIVEELRIYVICGEVYPICAVRQSMTSEQNAQAVDSRQLSQDEIDFSLKAYSRNDSMDIVGLDIARNSDGKLCLMEVNRSPGFAAFAKLTGRNLADVLYSKFK